MSRAGMRGPSQQGQDMPDSFNSRLTRVTDPTMIARIKQQEGQGDVPN